MYPRKKASHESLVRLMHVVDLYMCLWVGVCRCGCVGVGGGVRGGGEGGGP